MTATSDRGGGRTFADLLATAERVATVLESTAVERDRKGGTAKAQRSLLRDSSLLHLTVDPSLGGDGLHWQDTFKIVRTIARADSSLGHLFGFQHLHLATVRLFGDQWRDLHRQSATSNWFWGNALNPLDTRTTIERAGSDWVVRGTKSFCSGASDSDRLLLSAKSPEGKLVIATIPTDRAGISVLADWDNMGQRQTDSGSVVFRDVVVRDEEILRNPGPLGSVFATLRPLIAQLVLVNVYLGIAEGALRAARNFTVESARPWHSSGVARAADDPFIGRSFGEFHVLASSARLATDDAARLLDLAYSRQDALTEAERGEVAVATATAKVLAARAGLEISQRLFEVAGARATSAKLGLDRFWRNIRTHTLHDPLDYKLAELGAWVLHDRIPTPSFYS